jgi:excisionase family DNA binding protein
MTNDNASDNAPDWLTVAQAAALLRLPLRKVYRLIDRHDLESDKGKPQRVSRASLEAYNNQVLARDAAGYFAVSESDNAMTNDKLSKRATTELAANTFQYIQAERDKLWSRNQELEEEVRAMYRERDVLKDKHAAEVAALNQRLIDSALSLGTLQATVNQALESVQAAQEPPQPVKVELPASVLEMPTASPQPPKRSSWWSRMFGGKG